MWQVRPSSGLKFVCERTQHFSPAGADLDRDGKNFFSGIFVGVCFSNAIFGIWGIYPLILLILLISNLANLSDVSNLFYVDRQMESLPLKIDDFAHILTSYRKTLVSMSETYEHRSDEHQCS